MVRPKMRRDAPKSDLEKEQRRRHQAGDQKVFKRHQNDTNKGFKTVENRFKFHLVFGALLGGEVGGTNVVMLIM